METINLFPQILKAFKYSNNTNFLLEEINKIKALYPNKAPSLFKDAIYTSPNFLFQSYKNFKFLENDIKSLVLKNYNKNCKITDSWINIYYKHGYNDFHNHFKNDLAGVLYLKVPKSHPGINFHNKHNPIQIFNYKPPSNTIIFFDGDQYHSSFPNPENTEKIIIAFNISFKD